MGTADFSADRSTIGKIYLDDTKNSNFKQVTSTIASPDDVDWIKVTLIGGETYAFGIFTLYDLWLKGLSSENLDGVIWDTPHSSIYFEWTDPQPGAHSFYIHVGAGGLGSSVGSYDVYVHPFNEINYLATTTKQYAENNCTSYVAWRVSDYYKNSYFPGNLGNANTWDNLSKNLYHWKTEKDPSVGDIAQTDAYGKGHVAFVEGVEKDSNGNVVSIDISEYNWGRDEKYGERFHVSPSSFTSYIRPYTYDPSSGNTGQGGTALHGYLAHALVWVDTNDNGQRDWIDANGNGVWDTGEGESWTLTDGNGHFAGLIGSGTLRLTANPLGGTIDISTGKAFTGSYSALSGSTIINPLTTLIFASEGDTDVVKTALGLDIGLDLFTYDPLASLSLGESASNEAVAIKAQSAATQMDNLLQIVTSINSAAGSNASSSDIATSLANVLIAAAGPSGTINLADSTVLQNAIISTAQLMVTDEVALSIIINHAGVIADALALVNLKIESVSDAADATALAGYVIDVAGALTRIVSAQIVAQDTLSGQVAQVIHDDSNAPITITSGNIDHSIDTASSEVGQIFVPIAGETQINHAPSGSVVITGIAMQNMTLSVSNSLADVDGLGVISYIWKADGVAISNATASTYTVTSSDVRKAIAVTASYTDHLGNIETVSSHATTSVDPLPSQIFGTSGDDTFHAGSGNKAIDGLAGIDTVIFSGHQSAYTIVLAGAGFVVKDNVGTDGTDTVINIEKLQFADHTLTIAPTPDATLLESYRIYKAAFDRAPDYGGLGFWYKSMAGGTSLNDVALGFSHSQECMDMYGSNPTDANFLTLLYQHVLGRTYDQGGYDWWLNTLTTHANTQAKVLAQFSESPENIAHVAGVIANGIIYEAYAG